ncbi:hypothetical protein COX84_02185 [Candidatus Micrarchaeota archaeon CG_4_10_14_0_2_um_filter_49_7]|nr:MAG: hypothetical protein COX84_02185 [Candidatus Micrarchaeota archaeon CG_4_10_14_0_2_um_filter_49_7]HII54167.1 glycosyltransferase family 4 protein [Candidatus Micrarchaeota archaeon]
MKYTGILMKIAMLGPFEHPPREGGVERHVHYLSENLEKLGVEIERHSWKAGSSSAGVSGITKISLPCLGGLFAKSDADIVHLHSTAIVFSLLSGLGKFRKKSVATIHSFYHPEYESSFRMKTVVSALKLPYVLALKRIPKHIAVSGFMKDEAAGQGIIDAEVIPNGIPFAELQSVRPAAEYESDVVFAGRFSEQKGIFDFIEALGSSNLRAAVAGYGDPSIERKIAGLCGKAGIRCHIRPATETMMQVIKSARVFAFPSKYEPFGIVGLEALALGKPVVVYKQSGGPLDYILDGVNGLAIGANPGALRQAVASLLKNESMLKKMSSNASASAKKFDWADIAQETKAFYEKINS